MPLTPLVGASEQVAVRPPGGRPGALADLALRPEPACEGASGRPQCGVVCSPGDTRVSVNT